MALGMMLPGFVSGWLQQMVGYKTFFIIICCMTIPGMLTIPFIPLDKMENQARSVGAKLRKEEK